MGLWRAAVIAVLAGIIVYHYQGGNPPEIIEPLNPADAPRLPENVTRSVLIVGGGLAGLSAALELAERGYNVTIRDKFAVLGGRVSTEQIEALGQTWNIERGFHGWFHNYHNLKDLRDRLDVNHHFKPWIENYFMFRNYEPEEIHSIGPYPLNLLGIVFRSPNLQILKTMLSVKMTFNMWFFDHSTVYKNFDHLTYEEYCDKNGVDRAFRDIILKPAISASFNEPANFSAAEMIMFSHLYFMSDEQADLREITKVDHGHALITPLVARFKEFGGIVQTSTSVEKLHFDQSTSRISDGENNFDYIILATDLVGTKKILQESIKAEKTRSKKDPLVQLTENVSYLPVAPPYKVMRVWFDKQLENSTVYSILQTPEHDPVNLVIQYHMLEEESISWAKKTGGSIMEFHLYTWKYGHVEDDEVWDIVSPSIRDIYPEIMERKFEILYYHIYSFQNFASFSSGSADIRPTTNTPSKLGIQNLYLAGDWLQTSYPSALMERATSTGREAANHILLSDHVRQVPLKVTSRYGPGIF